MFAVIFFELPQQFDTLLKLKLPHFINPALPFLFWLWFPWVTQSLRLLASSRANIGLEHGKVAEARYHLLFCGFQPCFLSETSPFLLNLQQPNLEENSSKGSCAERNEVRRAGPDRTYPQTGMSPLLSIASLGLLWVKINGFWAAGIWTLGQAEISPATPLFLFFVYNSIFSPVDYYSAFVVASVRTLATSYAKAILMAELWTARRQWELSRH